MRFTPPLARARLIRRYKRFLADVETAAGVTTMHCPNTGAMTGCCDSGLEVWYSTSPNAARKYSHTLEVVCTRRGRVGVNTARANRLVAEALAADRIVELAGYRKVTAEARIPDHAGPRAGRLDFLLEDARTRCWLEVKSLTLCLGRGMGAFPDATSERALRHLDALVARRRCGERAVLLFCVQHTGVRYATAADEVHPAYGAALRAAAADDGVEVLAYACRIERRGMEITAPLPVRL